MESKFSFGKKYCLYVPYFHDFLLYVIFTGCWGAPVGCRILPQRPPSHDEPQHDVHARGSHREQNAGPRDAKAGD